MLSKVLMLDGGAAIPIGVTDPNQSWFKINTLTVEFWVKPMASLADTTVAVISTLNEYGDSEGTGQLFYNIRNPSGFYQ